MNSNRYLLIFLFLFTSLYTVAQCTIDSTQTVPGIYPDTLPDGTANQPYNEDITFVMLTDTLGFTVNTIQVVSIVGLPPGMTWACNSPGNSCTYTPANSIYGCINFSGTPLLADTYAITVNLIANIQLLGNQPLSLDAPLIIQPGNSSNGNFTLSNPSGCSPLTVGITNNTPGQIDYLWDFGNGDTSTVENPPNVIYTQGGTYIISLTSTPPDDNYFLTGVNIDSIPDAYGDLFNLDDADLYFLVKDTSGTTIFDSRPALNALYPPQSFNTGFVSLGDQTYTLEVWDEDGFPFGADDALGTISFAGHGSSGNALDSISGVTGYLSVAYTIINPILPPVTSIDTVVVFDTPAVPVVTASGSLDFCDGDSVILSNTGTILHQWYESNVLIAGANDSSLTILTSGAYSLTVSTIDGCNATSPIYNVNAYPNPPKPNFFVNVGVLTCPLTGYQLEWLLNGVLIAGASGSTYTPTVSGTYTCLATDTTNASACSTLSDPLVLTGVGIGEISENGFEVYPNPASEFLNVKWNSSTSISKLQIMDLSGRMVFEKNLNAYSKVEKILTGEFARGTYFILLLDNSTVKYSKRIVLQ